MIMGLDRTYHAHHFIFSIIFSCGRLSWLPVSFLMHDKYTLSYRIVSCRKESAEGCVGAHTHPSALSLRHWGALVHHIRGVGVPELA